MRRRTGVLIDPGAEAAFVPHYRCILGSVGRARGAPSAPPAGPRHGRSSPSAVCLLQQDGNLRGWSQDLLVLLPPSGSHAAGFLSRCRKFLVS